MRYTLAALAIAGAVAPIVAPAQESAIESVISRQIDAFRADDFETAFTFASPMIRGLFGSADRFGQMVRQGYPMVYRPADVDFLDAREVGPVVRQRVMMRDASGAIHVLQYEMVETGGLWQINGVQLLRAPQVGA